MNNKSDIKMDKIDKGPKPNVRIHTQRRDSDDDIGISQISHLVLTDIKDSPLRMKLVLLLAFSLMSVICMMIQLSIGVLPHKYDDITTALNWYLKLLISFLTLISLHLLWEYYNLCLSREADKLKTVVGVEIAMKHILTSPMRNSFIIEFILLSLHLPPTSMNMKADDATNQWNLIIFIRLYLLFRVIRDYQYLFRYRDLYDSGKHSNEFESIWFSVKSAFYHHPNWCILIPSALCFFVMSFCVWVTERSLEGTEFDFTTTMWFIFASMTTVGYGDVVCDHPFSKALSVFATILGIILASMYVAILSNQFMLTDHQKTAIQWAVASKTAFDEKIAGAELIQALFRYWKMSGKKRISVRGHQDKESKRLNIYRKRAFDKMVAFRRIRIEKNVDEYTRNDRMSEVQSIIADTHLLSYYMMKELNPTLSENIIEKMNTTPSLIKTRELVETPRIHNKIILEEFTSTGRRNSVKLSDIGMHAEGNIQLEILKELRNIKQDMKNMQQQINHLEKTIDEELPEALVMIAKRQQYHHNNNNQNNDSPVRKTR